MSLPREKASAAGVGYREALVAAVFEAADDGLVVLDADRPGHPILCANAAFAAILGATDPRALEGRPLLDILGEREHLILAAFIQALFRPGAERQLLWGRGSGAEGRSYLVAARILGGAPGPNACVLSCTRLGASDPHLAPAVTAAALAASEQRYRVVADSYPGYVQEMSFEGNHLHCLWASEGFQSTYGCDCLEFERRGGWRHFRHPDDIAATEERVARLLAGEATDGEARILREDGEVRWIRLITRPLRDASGRVTGAIGVVHDLTAERRLAEFVRETNAAARVGGWEMNLRTGAVRWSEEMFRILETTPEEFPLSWAAIEPLYVDKNDASIVAAREAARRGEAYDFEVQATTLKGRRIWLRVLGRYDFAGGTAHRAHGAVMDITERKQAGFALERSESLLRTLANSSPDWLVLVDGNYLVQFVNHGVKALTIEDIVGQPLRGLVPEESWEQARSVLDRTLATGALGQYGFICLGPQGELRDFEVMVAPVQERGRITGLVLRASDVTDKRQVEDALQTQAKILETMQEGVILLDGSGTIRLVNPAACTLFSLNGAMLLGKSVAELGLPIAATRRAAPVELPFRRRGAAPARIEARFTQVRIGGEPFTIGVLLDISERRRLEQELLSVVEREQQRIGGDLHDGLGQELTGVALMLRTLVSRAGKGDPPGVAALEEIIGVVNHASDVARQLARGLSPVGSSREGLAAALGQLCRQAGERFGFPVRFRESVVPAPLGPNAATHLYRIAQEGLTNAARHAAPASVTVELAHSQAGVMLAIRDDGCGFDLARSEAPGIGLRLMQYRAHLLGGTLEVESAPGRGTSVTCRCPQERRPD